MRWVTDLKGFLEGICWFFTAFEVVLSDVLRQTVRVVEGQLEPGLRLVAEVRHGHRHRDVYGGEEPEEDDGKEAADREEDEGGATVDDCSDEEEHAEEGEDSQDAHSNWPSQSLYFVDTAEGKIVRLGKWCQGTYLAGTLAMLTGL